MVKWLGGSKSVPVPVPVPYQGHGFALLGIIRAYPIKAPLTLAFRHKKTGSGDRAGLRFYQGAITPEAVRSLG